MKKLLYNPWLWLGVGLFSLLQGGCQRESTPAAKESPSVAAAPESGASPDQKATSDGANLSTATVNSERSPSAQTGVKPDASAAGKATAATPTSSAEPASMAKSPRELPESAQSKDDSGTAAATPPESVQTLFADWPQPRAVLVITGQQQGYIEPCGCTGLVNQKGGLARRFTFLRELRDRGWPVLALDAGNQVRRFGRQAEIKFQMTVAGLEAMGYGAAVLGIDDLQLSSGELLASIMGNDGQAKLFLGANVTVLDPTLMPKFRILEEAGVKIGVTGVMGSAYRDRIQNDEIVYQPPVEALQATLPELTAANCDLLVLLVHGSVEEARELAQQFPAFQVVVAAGNSGDPAVPPFQPAPIPGSSAMLIQSGIKGMYASVVGIFADEQKPLRYQRVVFDARYEDAPEMLQLLKSYQGQLETLGLAELGLRPIPHPSGQQFIGSEKCGECHTSAFAVWEKSAHVHATQSLIEPGERTEIARHFDPECLSCHVTGWNPQRYYPYESGYLSLTASAHLLGNGCENCHGPGAQHASVESGDSAATDELRKRLREQMRLPLSEARQRCQECHDLDNSPDFQAEGAFERYWKNGIEHYGKD
jgi:hypothetical protein